MLSVRFASEMGRTSLSENSQKLYCAQNLVNTKLVEEGLGFNFLIWALVENFTVVDKIRSETKILLGPKCFSYSFVCC